MIERRVHRYELKLVSIDAATDKHTQVSTFDAFNAINALSRGTAPSIVGTPGHVHYVLPGQKRRYLVHVLSNTLEYAFGRICRTNMADLPYGEIGGELEPLGIDRDAGISYESYFWLDHARGDMVIEYTQLGPKYGDLLRYLEVKLSGHADTPVEQVSLLPVLDDDMFERFLNQQGPISELQILVERKEAVEFLRTARGLGARTNPEMIAIAEQAVRSARYVREAEQVGVYYKRKKNARRGGMMSLKPQLINFLRKQPTMLSKVSGFVEGSKDDGGATERFNLLSERTARRIRVREDRENARYVDPDDMAEKLHEIYLKMLGNEEDSDGKGPSN